MRDSLSVLHGQIAASVPAITAAYSAVVVEPIRAAGNNPASQYRATESDLPQTDHRPLRRFPSRGREHHVGHMDIRDGRGSWSGTRQ